VAKPKKIYNTNPGTKYANWTIIEYLGPIGKGRIKSCLAECSCENKTRKIKTMFALESGRSKSCGCKKQRTPLTIKYPDKKAPRVIFGIKGAAATRNLIFSLDDLYAFEKYCLGSCFYCGFKPSWPETHNGIDRYDNSKGYIEGNCVSCCFKCNMTKNDNGVKEFEYRIRKMYDYSILNNNIEWVDENIEIKCGSFVYKNKETKNYGKRHTDISKKYPESYDLVPGSYAQSVWRIVDDSCKATSKNNKITYDLDPLKAFENYIIGCCSYCGLKPQFPHTRNGIDRVDSSKGYTEDNCVSCCTFCNYSKLDYTIDEFKEWIIRIYTHLTTVGWNI
jgi:5-methylcytosine-specific restriction endonuclease McrA